MLAATISRSARYGFWAGPLIVAGHGALELLVVIGAAFGLQRYIQADMVRGAVALVGAVVLLLMGFDLLRNVRRLSMSISGGSKLSKTGSVAAGVATSVSNPYWWIWWVGAGIPTYVATAGENGLPGAISFLSGHITSDLAWYSFAAFLVSRGRGNGRGLMNDAVYRGLMLVCGLVLIGFGAWFGWNGITWLRG